MNGPSDGIGAVQTPDETTDGRDGGI
jgi:hypothetical protein